MRVSLFVEGSPDTCVAGVATQSTDVLALVMRLCVQLPLKRGATTPSSLNAVKGLGRPKARVKATQQQARELGSCTKGTREMWINTIPHACFSAISCIAHLFLRSTFQVDSSLTDER